MSSRDTAENAVDDDLPPALSSMWRLCKLGYQHEPGLMAFALGSALLAALPDALLALWLKLLGEGVVDGRPRPRAPGRLRAGRVGGRHLVPAHRVHAAPAPLPGQGHDRARVARRPAAGVGRHRRPPGATRAASTACRCCATRCSCSTTCTCRCSPPPASCCASWSPSSCWRRSTRRCCCSASSPSPPCITSSWRPAVERRAEERGASAKRLASHLFTTATTAPPGKEVRVTGIGPRLDHAAARVLGALVRAGGVGPLGRRRCGTAWRGRSSGPAYVGGVVFVASGHRRPAPATCCWCWPPAPGCRPTSAPPSARSGSCAGIWMDGSQRLAWLEDYAAAIVAKGDLPVPDRIERRHHLRGRVASPTRAPTASCCEDVSRHAAGGGRGGRGGRERRRQDHPGQAPGQALRADQRPHPGRRRRPGPHAGGRVARPAGRRLPGLLPLRAAGPPERRPRRRAARGRRARRSPPPSAAPAPTTWSTTWRPGSTPSSARPGPRASR